MHNTTRLVRLVDVKRLRSIEEVGRVLGTRRLRRRGEVHRGVDVERAHRAPAPTLAPAPGRRTARQDRFEPVQAALDGAPQLALMLLRVHDELLRFALRLQLGGCGVRGGGRHLDRERAAEHERLVRAVGGPAPRPRVHRGGYEAAAARAAAGAVARRGGAAGARRAARGQARGELRAVRDLDVEVGQPLRRLAAPAVERVGAARARRGEGGARRRARRGVHAAPQRGPQLQQLEGVGRRPPAGLRAGGARGRGRPPRAGGLRPTTPLAHELSITLHEGGTLELTGTTAAPKQNCFRLNKCEMTSDKSLSVLVTHSY